MGEIIVEEKTRAQVMAALAAAIIRTLELYEEFTKMVKTADKSKDFAEHHKAAKAAIGHLELLLKLVSSLFQAPKTEMENEETLKLLTHQAREAVEDYERNYAHLYENDLA